MKGKLLLAWPLGGPVRPDLPASLLSEGNLAGLALAEYTQIGRPRVLEAIGALRAALASAPAPGRRPEDLPGPFLWHF